MAVFTEEFRSLVQLFPAFHVSTRGISSRYLSMMVKVYPLRNVGIRSISKPATTQKNAEEFYFIQCCISSQHSGKYSVCVPKSLLAVDTLKFGKIIKPIEKKILNLGVEEFDTESKEWVVLDPVSFVTEIAPFGEGCFRYAFKALSNRHKFRDANYVIKPFKMSALENIDILKQPPEIQSRKVELIGQKFSCTTFRSMRHCY